jgi:hypothetical protein
MPLLKMTNPSTRHFEGHARDICRFGVSRYIGQIRQASFNNRIIPELHDPKEQQIHR